MFSGCSLRVRRKIAKMYIMQIAGIKWELKKGRIFTVALVLSGCIVVKM